MKQVGDYTKRVGTLTFGKLMGLLLVSEHQSRDIALGIRWTVSENHGASYRTELQQVG